ncbi:hypothetical protein [Streptomyces sp. A012304]|uniref:hypothetical protein n=1 Tax=Streptomyces sp. A012304 TaxID=375446 RepID=UPI00223135FE|nr:hypothetical protein [Streptomyces sp. A012304]GKQ40351.1 hypothetical protein ALMP_68770 [Streptomyces sp. A012304]
MPTPKRLAGTFSPLDFQLVLLRRMADHNADLVDEIRHELGIPLTRMREANRRWQAMIHSPHGRGALSRYHAVLGEPESRTPRRVGDLDCETWHWPVSFWPELRFELLVSDKRSVGNEWLVRAPDAPAPDLRTLEDLTPWSCTVEEVAGAFTPAHPLEGEPPARSGLAFIAPDRNGVRREVAAEFAWGLLQRVAVSG